MINPIGTTRTHKKGYDYFHPNPFPPELESLFTEALITKADEAQYLLGKLSGITYLLPDVDFFISAYITKDATSSSQIEGTQATMIEAFEYSTDPNMLGSTDADDITHYIQALNHGLTRLSELPLSLRFIRELHGELMKGARSSHFADPGEFRRSQNWIGGTTPNNASFVPPPHEELDLPLGDLEKFMHKRHFHPLIQAGLLHSQFETLHPFLDGNGRTGRLLITFFLIEKRLLEKPVLFLSSYFKKHQKTYYERLSGYHSGNVLTWLDFFLDGMIETATQAIEVSRMITEQRERDMQKVHAFGKSLANTSVTILQKLYTNPVVTMPLLETWTGYSRAGVLKVINRFVDAGILRLLRKGEGNRPSVYIHGEYVKIFEDK